MRLLTDKLIRGAKTHFDRSGNPIKYDLVDSTRERGVGRLVLRVNASGSKVFAYRFKIDGKFSFIQIGQYPSVSLSQAREAMLPFIQDLQAGKNPKLELEKKREDQKKKDLEESKQGTIEQLFNAYTDKMRVDGKSTYKEVLKNLDKEVYPKINKETRAKDAKVEDFVDILAGMISRGAGVQTNRVRSYLHAAFSYGLKQDLDPAVKVKNIKFGLTVNPISGIPKQAQFEATGTRFLTIPQLVELIPLFIKTKGVGYQTTMWLKLCIYLGGQRPHEIARLTWDDVNWEDKYIKMLPEITKNSRTHLVPLNTLALDALKDLKKNGKQSSFLFPKATNRNEHVCFDTISKALSKFREQFPAYPKFVPRDIRRSAKTGMTSNGVSKQIADRVHNHALKDVSGKHYDMYDYFQEKKQVLDKWNELLEEANAKMLAKPN